MKNSTSTSESQRQHLFKILPVFVVLLGLLAALHLWLATALGNDSNFSSGVKTAIWGLMFVGYMILPMSFLAGMTHKKIVPDWIKYLAFSWLGTFWIWISFHIFFSFIGFVVSLFTEIHLPVIFSSTMVAFSLATWALWKGFRKPHVHEVSVPLPNWPDSLEGLRVVQLSDVHAGMLFVKEKFVQDVVDQVNELNADIVVITGDLVEGSVSRVKDYLKPLAHIKSKYGRFYVTGNHEYYHGGSIWEKIMTDLGWIVLSNSHEILKINSVDLAIVGVTDYMAAQIEPSAKSDPQAAFDGIDPEIPRLFLAHEPRSLNQARGHRIDLQLSGHTHGGQIFPLNFLVYAQQPTNRGLKKIKSTWIYTHMGTGFWGPPMRLGTFSEIAVLLLSKAKS